MDPQKVKNQKLEVVFDPSLLFAPSHLLLKEIWNDSYINIVLTKRMKEIVFDYGERYPLPNVSADLRREAGNLHMLLNAWVSDNKQYQLATPSFVFRRQKFVVKELLKKEDQQFRDQQVIEALKRHTDFCIPLLGFPFSLGRVFF
jgi:hypothetical protein